jgi:hypothetical protein
MPLSIETSMWSSLEDNLVLQHPGLPWASHDVNVPKWHSTPILQEWGS